ncbi:MAG: CAP domain-containing protein [Chloroflexi bacterium]|nr:CAP domain-containing protein [Chloroflexota bacterium]
MKKAFLLLFLFSFILLTILPAASVIRARAQAGTVYDLIAAVNALRNAQGLTPLEIDGSLMSAAQSQSDYQASVGYWTHEGAGGTSPKDRAVAAGFGGGATIYVSENVAVLNPSATFDTLIYSIWSDSLHWNTMTNPNYTHAGAGITVSGDEVYYTLDVAYVAGSTGGYVTGGSTSTPGGAGFEATTAAGEVINPVITATPHEDGSVVHVVDQGQALWSIAIAYNTTIANIIFLNNLDPDNPSIWPGNELLIQPSLMPSSTVPVTPTKLPATRTPHPSYTPRPIVPTRTATIVPTATPEPFIQLPSLKTINRHSLGIAIIAVCAAGLLAVIITGFRPSK